MEKLSWLPSFSTQGGRRGHQGKQARTATVSRAATSHGPSQEQEENFKEAGCLPLKLVNSFEQTNLEKRFKSISIFEFRRICLWYSFQLFLKFYLCITYSLLIYFQCWGCNSGPHLCQARALPLSYSPALCAHLLCGSVSVSFRLLYG
jgi:hypothetical protein